MSSSRISAELKDFKEASKVLRQLPEGRRLSAYTTLPVSEEALYEHHTTSSGWKSRARPTAIGVLGQPSELMPGLVDQFSDRLLMIYPTVVTMKLVRPFV